MKWNGFLPEREQIIGSVSACFSSLKDDGPLILTLCHR